MGGVGGGRLERELLDEGAKEVKVLTHRRKETLLGAKRSSQYCGR